MPEDTRPAASFPVFDIGNVERASSDLFRQRIVGQARHLSFPASGGGSKTSRTIPMIRSVAAKSGPWTICRQYRTLPAKFQGGSRCRPMRLTIRGPRESPPNASPRRPPKANPGACRPPSLWRGCTSCRTPPFRSDRATTWPRKSRLCCSTCRHEPRRNNPVTSFPWAASRNPAGELTGGGRFHGPLVSERLYGSGIYRDLVV